MLCNILFQYFDWLYKAWSIYDFCFCFCVFLLYLFYFWGFVFFVNKWVNVKFGLDPITAGNYVSALFFGELIIVPITGWLGDLYGHRTTQLVLGEFCFADLGLGQPDMLRWEQLIHIILDSMLWHNRFPIVQFRTHQKDIWGHLFGFDLIGREAVVRLIFKNDHE